MAAAGVRLRLIGLTEHARHAGSGRRSPRLAMVHQRFGAARRFPTDLKLLAPFSTPRKPSDRSMTSWATPVRAPARGTRSGPRQRRRRLPAARRGSARPRSPRRCPPTCGRTTGFRPATTRAVSDSARALETAFTRRLAPTHPRGEPLPRAPRRRLSSAEAVGPRDGPLSLRRGRNGRRGAPLALPLPKPCLLCRGSTGRSLGGQAGPSFDSCGRGRVRMSRESTLNRTQVAAAVARLRDRIAETMDGSGLPGLALGVLFDGDVMAADGFGVRTLGEEAAVDADTVFQLASLSKSVAGSVMAAFIRERALAWDDRVRTGDPAFALSDPWLTEHATYADLFSHRSGLPKHAADLLEDLGHTRDTVLERLRLYPLGPFRVTHAYGNFGLTAAAVAAAARAGTTWEDASRQLLYKPLGMSSTSSTYADFVSRTNRAIGHVRPDGRWRVTPQPRAAGRAVAGGWGLQHGQRHAALATDANRRRRRRRLSRPRCRCVGRVLVAPGRLQSP